MLEHLEELARLMIRVWCEWETMPAPGAELSFLIGEFTVTLKRNKYEKVLTDSEIFDAVLSNAGGESVAVPA